MSALSKPAYGRLWPGRTKLTALAITLSMHTEIDEPLSEKKERELLLPEDQPEQRDSNPVISPLQSCVIK